MRLPGLHSRTVPAGFRRLAAAALLTAALLSGCSEPPEISLTFEEQALIDTLYTKEVAGLRGKLDSLCQKITARDMQHLVDSIVRSRHEEEAEMLQRIRRENEE